MKRDILNTIDMLYSKGDFQYILNKYIDRQYWDGNINKELENTSVDNLTDFSYSTCFSYFIKSSLSPNLRFGSDEFVNYLKGNLDIVGVMVLISVIAPYSVVKYVKYTYHDGNIQLHEQYSPLNQETEMIGKYILKMLNKNGIEKIDESVLNIVLPNISLELKEEDVTVYNCLFEDSL